MFLQVYQGGGQTWSELVRAGVEKLDLVLWLPHCQRSGNVVSCPEFIMMVRALLLLVFSVSAHLILHTCPPGQRCSDRQFCDHRGAVTSFRTNKLSFSSDQRGLQNCWTAGQERLGVCCWLELDNEDYFQFDEEQIQIDQSNQPGNTKTQTANLPPMSPPWEISSSQSIPLYLILDQEEINFETIRKLRNVREKIKLKDIPTIFQSIKPTTPEKESSDIRQRRLYLILLLQKLISFILVPSFYWMFWV